MPLHGGIVTKSHLPSLGPSSGTGTAPRLPGTQRERLGSEGCALVLPLPQQLNEAECGQFQGGDASVAPTAAGPALSLPCKATLISLICNMSYAHFTPSCFEVLGKGVAENSVLLRSDVASMPNRIPTFRSNTYCPHIQGSKCPREYFDPWRLRTICCLETSGSDDPLTQRHFPAELFHSHFTLG